MTSTTPVYNRRSLAYEVVSHALGKPLWWALEQLSLVDSEHVEPEEVLWKKVKGKYVVLTNVEKVADVIAEALRQNVTSSPADSLYSFESFRRRFNHIGAALEDTALSDTDLRVLLKFLDRDRKIIVTEGDVS